MPLEIKVKAVSDGIELSCTDQKKIIKPSNGEKNQNSLKLQYKDENSGEYECVSNNNNDNQEEHNPKIFVKFRSKFCSNFIFLVR